MKKEDTSAGQNLIAACLITGVFDVNRTEILPDNDPEPFLAWADSLRRLQLRGVLFHNNLSPALCESMESAHLRLVRISYDTRWNPNVYRYTIYHEFLQREGPQIAHVFFTDVSDVVVLKNPFTDPDFYLHPTTLFCGDEPKNLDNDWMKAHSTHLRSQIADYAQFEEKWKDSPLLNCGIIGGSRAVMTECIGALHHIHTQYNHNNTTAYTGDMGAFNYLARTRFSDRLRHGVPVNTVFKAYQTSDETCWFRHK
ncbi:hypothetical protein [Arundinibacter roseus]|uniref:DUF616 domain-containing protein n=1 Tax=Arundinibacter roseus TaxID=2070510 RepID=A0A4R4K6M7_9BACT|nr:hypothetical protein [Arundinibacter roseus]TDB62352.1 hypothetical protein EZE20_18395 [Arundinibacter roseus]